MMKKDLSESVARRFKEVRQKLKLKQTVVSKEIEQMLKSGEIYIKGDEENKSFSQTILSYIETNNSGVRKERLYVLIKYYEMRHDINPGYFFSESKQIQMNLMSGFFDLGGEKIIKKDLEEIFERHEMKFKEIENSIINDIIEIKKS